MEKNISKNKIEKRIVRKRDPFLVKALIKLKKTNPIVAKEFSKPKRRWASVNLKEISHVDGDVLVCGKVLSAGHLDKGKKIVAWGASEKAKNKIKEMKGEFVELKSELEKNPELNNLVIVK
jgi:ribosomal protein L18E